jgi:inner membrane protein
MASVGHIAVGLAAARMDDGRGPAWRQRVWWSALSLLPDADVVGFAFGVRYADTWGHRGATHSLAFAIVVGLGAGLVARRFNRPAARTTFIAILVLASHAVLDTMTDGGLGCALLWPFDQTRYFAPWRPIPVAPIGLAFISLHGAIIALTELVLFSPLLLLALRRSAANVGKAAIAGFLALWLSAVWLISSDAGLRDDIVGLLVREDTAYTAGFSEAAFRTIRHGQSEEELRHSLGAPIGESWIYSSINQPPEPAIDRSAASIANECLAMRFKGGALVTALHDEACRKRGVQAGMPLTEVERLLGRPSESCWQYTWSPATRPHRMRMVCFVGGRAASVFRHWSWPSFE